MPFKQQKSRLPAILATVRTGSPEELRPQMEGWGDLEMGLVAANVARTAIAAGRPDMLALALEPRFNPRPDLPGLSGHELVNGVLEAAKSALAAAKARILRSQPPQQDPRLVHAPGMLRLLAAAGFRLEDPDSSAPQPLFVAVALGLEDVVACLLDNGVDPDGLVDACPGNRACPLAAAGTDTMMRLLMAAPPAPRPLRLDNLLVWHDRLEPLLSAWRQCGGKWDDALEMPAGWRSSSLGSLAFAPLPKPSPPSARQLRPLLQRALVACGFDLDALAPDGRTWREHARRTACAPVRKWLMLSQLPQAAQTRRPRF